MSLRARLLLGLAVVAVVLVASALVITRSTRAHLVEQVDEQLLDAGPQLRGILGSQDADGPGRPAPRLSDIYVGVLGARGDLVTLHAPDLRSGSAPLPVVDAPAAAALRAGRAVTVDSDASSSRYRLMARTEGQRGRLAVVGRSLDDTDSAIRRLVAVEGLAVVSILAALGLVTWWVIRLGVRPIRRMTETAGAIAAGDLSQRVPETTPGTEAGALGVALNGMLERIEDAFEQRSASEARLRQFVADASHELRTPVTTIRGYAELYRSGGLADDSELSEAMRRTEQETVRMGALVDDLLRLARLDERRPVPSTPVALGALAADAVRDARASAPDRTVTLAADDQATVRGDEDGLRQVVANLVNNALVHAPGASVEVSVRTEGDRVVLAVSDDGPGMSDHDAQRAFERFYRADASRSRHQGGSGLGLAIVEGTVRAHGGDVALDTSAGHGTTVRVTLPLIPRP